MIIIYSIGRFKIFRFAAKLSVENRKSVLQPPLMPHLRWTAAYSCDKQQIKRVRL